MTPELGIKDPDLHSKLFVEVQPAVGGYLKRTFDIVAGGLGLACSAPMFLVIAAAIKLSDGGPVLYRHKRIGRDGKHFNCIKFRSMCTDAATALREHLEKDPDAALEWAATQKLKKDPRITRVGRILRKTSIDELPQLLNILKGEMSLVGPRPICDDEIAKYGEIITDYLRARPGLTGAWQVSGRNDVGYEKRVILDRDYVNDWSFWKDLRIILRTIHVVITARGTY